MKEKANAISDIVEEVGRDLHSARRSERRLHCLRGMKPQGPEFLGRLWRAEPARGHKEL